jgi:hypothetical protein
LRMLPITLREFTCKESERVGESERTGGGGGEGGEAKRASAKASKRVRREARREGEREIDGERMGLGGKSANLP